MLGCGRGGEERKVGGGERVEEAEGSMLIP